MSCEMLTVRELGTVGTADLARWLRWAERIKWPNLKEAQAIRAAREELEFRAMMATRPNWR